MIASTRLICPSSFLQAGEWTDRRQHAHQALHRSHLFNLPQLIAEVFQREAVASQGAGGHFLRLLLVDLLFSALNQRQNVAHTENARDDAVGMERLQRVVFFAYTDELDGLPRDLANGKRRAASGVTIHLGEDGAGDGEEVVEGLGGFDGVLVSTTPVSESFL